MLHLLFVSLLWAFSFGLIKGELTGLPPAAVALLRLAIALAVFAPFIRLHALRLRDTLRLLLIGAVQYGLMYVAYIQSYRFLQAHEVALFTVFTPIYVTLIHDGFERRISRTALTAVLLAVAGGILIEYKQIGSPELLNGFLLMQLANLCFAFGQIFYRRTMADLSAPLRDVNVFGIVYLGATLAAAVATIGTDWRAIEITPKQIGILLYLGAIASGVGFFLWNRGARRISAGLLAVANNLKIPLGILVSVLVFKETADWPRMLGGGTLMIAALYINRRRAKQS